MTAFEEEEQRWEQEDLSHWRGLGLTDPIKSVEVRLAAQVRASSFLTLANFTGQMAASSCVSQSQRSREAAYRFFQLLCRCRHQKYSEG